MQCPARGATRTRSSGPSHRNRGVEMLVVLGSQTYRILLLDSCASRTAADRNESDRLGWKRQQYQREKRFTTLDGSAIAAI